MSNVLVGAVVKPTAEEAAWVGGDPPKKKRSIFKRCILTAKAVAVGDAGTSYVRRAV